MKRLSITLTDEAKDVYDSWKSHERSKKVSQAIVQYDSKETFTPEQKEWIRAEIRAMKEKK